jgi:hypothetical protein
METCDGEALGEAAGAMLGEALGEAAGAMLGEALAASGGGNGGEGLASVVPPPPFPSPCPQQHTLKLPSNFPSQLRHSNQARSYILPTPPYATHSRWGGAHPSRSSPQT